MTDTITDILSEMPAAVRFGLRIMKERAHKIEVTGGRPLAGELDVNVWLDDKQANPIYRVIYAKNATAHYREVRNGIRMAEFRIKNVSGVEESTETPRRTRSDISLRKREAVRKINGRHDEHILPDESVQSMFIRRIELIEEERKWGDKFIKEPNDYNRVMLGAVRQALNEVEDKIVGAQ